MKTKNLFLVSIGFAIFAVGCSSTPKVVQTIPVYTASAVVAEPSPYRFEQEPAKRVIGDSGREYSAHVRETQRMRLAHERKLAAIEQASEEALLAQEKGVVILSPSQPVQQAPVSYQQPAGGAAYQPRVYGNGWGGGFGSTSSFGTGSWTGVSGCAVVSGTTGGAGGKLFRWLTQSQSSPGYRHTGGPATVITTHSIGGGVGGIGQFSSGFAIQGIRR